MAFDIQLLANKLIQYRQQFNLTINELAKYTGIPSNRLQEFEQGNAVPYGDEILILADFYKCDYKFFISNAKASAIEQTEFLFRMLGDQLSTTDRWAIQEVLYLAECESYIKEELGLNSICFNFIKKDNYFKKHGIDATRKLREYLGYKFNEVPNVFQDFRKIGMFIFRRQLENSNISGICIKHPDIGNCILVNYNEDIYRQRFTVAHEAAHAILDDDKDVIVSFVKWDKKNLSEIRANTFASNYLIPEELLKIISSQDIMNPNIILNWVQKLKVNTEVLANALKSHGLINRKEQEFIKSIKIPSRLKIDPELPDNLSDGIKRRKKYLLEHGLSDHYVGLCLDAYRNNIISIARMAEMLLVDESDLFDLMQIFGEEIRYGQYN